MSERRVLALVMRTGVLVSFVLLAIGLAFSAGSPAPDLLTPGSPMDVVRGMGEGDAASWIHAGLLVLMLTPFSRVVVLLLYFGKSRDFPFLGVSIGVLLLLVGTVVARLF